MATIVTDRKYTIRGRKFVHGCIEKTVFLRESNTIEDKGPAMVRSFEEMLCYLSQLKSNYPKPWEWELRDA